MLPGALLLLKAHVSYAGEMAQTVVKTFWPSENSLSTGATSLDIRE